MGRCLVVLVLSACCVSPGFARHVPEICGTNPEFRKQELFLHRNAARVLRRSTGLRSLSETRLANAPVQDIGDIVVLPDDGGVVARRNPFDLDQQTLTFSPVAPFKSSYSFQMSANTYDPSAAAGTPIPLADDDSRQIPIAFPFPFFGNTYQSIFINSDGNLTFNVGDNGTTDRSLGRLAGGPPRIAPLFDDLNPAQSALGVTITSDATRLVVSWVQVPEYGDFGTGTFQTFQVRLYPDGRIQFAYFGINVQSAVVGIGPGALQGASALVSFTAGSTSVYSSTLADVFSGADEIDIEAATQRFLKTHDDSYDYVIFFNDEGISPGLGTLAWEQTLRNSRTGYGDVAVDDGAEYGSAARLQAVLNMGPLSQYPASATDIITLRASSGYDMLKLLGHEVGHLFLAFASVPDPNDLSAQPMLGIGLVHWAFNFNANGSFMEGNRIQDEGANAEPRFITTATVDRYSALDQYLMGLRAPADVPPTFLVTGNPPAFSVMFPEIGVSFDGDRQDIEIGDIIQAEGRRTPDYTVAQRHFRAAFVLITRAGTTPAPEEVAQVDGYRAQFEPFYSQATGGRAAIDTSLRRALAISVAPAAGVVMGASAAATISIQEPLNFPLEVSLQSGSGWIAVPPMVTIPTGATSANFSIGGLQSGVDDLTATTTDQRFETARARIQVLPPSEVTLSAVSGNWQVLHANGTVPQAVVVRATDQNNLPYPGAQLIATPVGGGAVAPAIALADATGQAAFRWTPRTMNAQLQVSLRGSSRPLSIAVLPPTSISATGVVNAASAVAGISPGGIVTIYGTSLADGFISQAGFPWPTELANVTVFLNHEPAQLLYVSDSQINFVAPMDLAPGTASLTVETGGGTSASLQVHVSAVAPGIFADPAAILGGVPNTSNPVGAEQQPAVPGGTIVVSCTGLGVVRQNSSGLMATVAQPQVSIGGIPAMVLSSALAADYNSGLYQVTVQLPPNTPAGTQPLVMTVGGIASNSVPVAVQ
jgi:uncharacterized protein (TIGR03437 family)